MALDLTQRQQLGKTYPAIGTMLPPPPDIRNYGNQGLESDAPSQPLPKPATDIPVLDLTTSTKDTEKRPSQENTGKARAPHTSTSNMVRVAPYPAHVSHQMKSPVHHDPKQQPQMYQTTTNYQQERHIPLKHDHSLKRSNKAGYACPPSNVHGPMPPSERTDTRAHYPQEPTMDKPMHSPVTPYPYPDQGQHTVAVAYPQHNPAQQVQYQSPYPSKMAVKTPDMNDPRAQNGSIQQTPAYQVVSPTYRQHHGPNYPHHTAPQQGYPVPQSQRETGPNSRVPAGANTYGYHPYQHPYHDYQMAKGGQMPEHKPSVPPSNYPVMQKQPNMHPQYMQTHPNTRPSSQHGPPGVYYQRQAYDQRQDPRQQPYSPSGNRYNHNGNTGHYSRQNVPARPNVPQLVRMGQPGYTQTDIQVVTSQKSYELTQKPPYYSQKSAPAPQTAVMKSTHVTNNDGMVQPEQTKIISKNTHDRLKPPVVAKVSAYIKANSQAPPPPMMYKRISPKPATSSPDPPSTKRIKVSSPSSTWTPPVAKLPPTIEEKEIIPCPEKDSSPRSVQSSEQKAIDAPVNLTLGRRERLPSAPTATLTESLDVHKSSPSQRPPPPKKSLSMPQDIQGQGPIQQIVDNSIAEAVKREVENVQKKRLDGEPILKPAAPSKIGRLLREEPLNLKRDIQIQLELSNIKPDPLKTERDTSTFNHSPSCDIQVMPKKSPTVMTALKTEPSTAPLNQSQAKEVADPPVKTEAATQKEHAYPQDNTAIDNKASALETVCEKVTLSKLVSQAESEPVKTEETLEQQDEVLDLSSKPNKPKEISTVVESTKFRLDEPDHPLTSSMAMLSKNDETKREAEVKVLPTEENKRQKSRSPDETTDILLEEQRFIVKLPIDPEVNLPEISTGEAEGDIPEEELWGFDSEKTTPTDKDEEQEIMFELAEPSTSMEIGENPDENSSRHPDKLVIRLRRVTVDNQENTTETLKNDESAKRDEAMRLLGLAKKA